MLVTSLVGTLPLWLPIVLGLIGTGLEATGNAVCVAIGRRLEAISVDFPKLLGKK